MKKLNFFQKQLLTYSLLLSVVTLIMIFWAHSYVMDISREKATVTQEQLTTSTLEQVDSYLDRIMLITTQVAHDSEIVSIMESLFTEENPSSNYFADDPAVLAYFSDLLAKHNEIKDPVYRIAVFNTAGDFICSDPSPSVLRDSVAFVAENDAFRDFLPRAFITEGREFIMMGPNKGVFPEHFEEENCIYMLMPIKNHDETEIYGYVQVFQPLEPLFAQLDLDKRTDIDVYLFFERNLGDRGGQIYPLDHDYPDTTTGNYYETERQSYYRWFVVLLQNQSEFLSSYRPMLVYLYLGGFALFLLLFLCAYLLIRHTSKPILELSKRVKEASLTNLPDLPVSDDALDEVKELERSVDHMMQRVKTSVELEQQAYLKALQAQMNPHFLYNCLSTISSLGTEAESPVIPRFCTHLASILRYETTYTNDLVTLEEELLNVQDYLALMKIRYEDDISYEVEAEEALRSLPLPRLVLQPLVENCFSHGFRAVEPPWRLSVRAFRENHQWVIRIADNGIGFDADKRAALEQQVDTLMNHLGQSYNDLKIGGMGLANTIVRLRLMSADPVFFSISQNEPTGTIITLRGELHD